VLRRRGGDARRSWDERRSAPSPLGEAVVTALPPGPPAGLPDELLGEDQPSRIEDLLRNRACHRVGATLSAWISATLNAALLVRVNAGKAPDCPPPAQVTDQVVVALTGYASSSCPALLARYVWPHVGEEEAGS
jgi:hypothetical protein